LRRARPGRTFFGPGEFEKAIEEMRGHRAMTRKTVFWILIIGMLGACWTRDVRINITFARLSGLVRQDRVLFEDNPIGEVLDIKYNPDGIYTVQVRIEKGFENAVTQYSHFRIVADPKLSDHKAVEVVLEQTGGTPLENGVTVSGESGETDFFKQLQEDLASGFDFFRKQIDKIDRDVREYPQSEEYRQLKKSLEDLGAEIERKEKQAREKIKREWLPKIQRELDGLREKLKQYGREEELEPLEREVDRIRRI
jgi:paraquat-inducible protein B